MRDEFEYCTKLSCRDPKEVQKFCIHRFVMRKIVNKARSQCRYGSCSLFYLSGRSSNTLGIFFCRLQNGHLFFCDVIFLLSELFIVTSYIQMTFSKPEFEVRSLMLGNKTELEIGRDSPRHRRSACRIRHLHLL